MALSRWQPEGPRGPLADHAPDDDQDGVDLRRSLLEAEWGGFSAGESPAVLASLPPDAATGAVCTICVVFWARRTIRFTNCLIGSPSWRGLLGFRSLRRHTRPSSSRCASWRNRMRPGCCVWYSHSGRCDSVVFGSVAGKCWSRRANRLSGAISRGAGGNWTLSGWWVGLRVHRTYHEPRLLSHASLLLPCRQEMVTGALVTSRAAFPGRWLQRRLGIPGWRVRV